MYNAYSGIQKTFTYMKRLILILSTMLLTLIGTDALAQKKDSDNDYNLKKALEVLREEKDEAKALDLVNKQLRETPDNIDALVFRAHLLRKKEDYGGALADLNHALKVNKPKKSGTPTSFLHWWKGYIYSDMGEDKRAAESLAEAYRLARKYNKGDLQNIAFDYAQFLYNIDDIDGADAIYIKMIADDESDQAAMVGRARNMIQRRQYQEALDMLSSCEKLGADYSEIYRFRFQAYERLGEENKAIDAALDWYDKDKDAGLDEIVAAAKKRPNYAEVQMKAKAKKSDDPFNWNVLLCKFYEESHRYLEAIGLYNQIEEGYGHNDRLNLYRSENYMNLGLYDKAIEDISRAMQKEPNWYFLASRGDYYRLAGDYDSAIADFSAAIEERPDLSYAYYKRGWCHEMKGDKAKALDDYNVGIDIDDEYPYLLLMRGTILLESGSRAEADADFEKILQLDTVAQSGSCRQYALHFLGKNQEATDWMEKIIASDPENNGCYYDKACLLSRMGRMEESITALRTALEKGFRSFAHLEHDDDLDQVRGYQEFISLVNEYKAKHESYMKENDLIAEPREESLTEIAFTRHSGGTFEIPCNINGLALQLIFDTGASDVTISSVEANFMLKNGYLSEKDIKGKRYYQVANGQINEGTVITLREVMIGDAVLHNVDASVVKSQRAPLLLGQSALERFGTITIDNNDNKLVIRH